MPNSYFTMWCMLILMALGALAGGIFHGDLFGFIRGAYPSDVMKQSALHRCLQMNPVFSRFSEQDRETCYQAILQASRQSALLGQ